MFTFNVLYPYTYLVYSVRINMFALKRVKIEIELIKT